MLLSIVLLVLGLAICAGGLYYLAQNRQDPESRKIYGVTALVGGLLALGALVWLLVF